MLTKTHFVLGQRCQKALHFNIFSPELASQSSNLELKLRHEGIEVGKYARSLYPDGILIDSEDVEVVLKETQKNIREGALTLFEAAFRFDDVIIRTDILTRQSINDPWKLYEVKATTYKSNDEARKEEFRQDIAIQVWVLQQSGIILEGTYLMHLNSECIYPNLSSLFISKDYFPEIISLLSEMPMQLEKLKTVLQNQVLPNVSIGPHCEQSEGCSFRDTCWNHIPKPSVFDIPNCRQRWKHFEDGRVAACQLSKSDFQSSTHLRVLKCYQENQPFFDKQLARKILQQWEYPLSYFDIEAIAYPIPRYPNSRPYQNLPFQFSCHIQRDENSELEHYEFLHDENNDPRLAFIQKMLEVIPQSGSIVVYHQTYEISRFKELARDFPDYAQAINDLIPRVVDLKKVIMDTVYYPGFLGSFSIKKVAPVLLGEKTNYHHLEVGDGIDAMLSYQKILNLGSYDSRKWEIKKSLLEYCKQDTLLMVYLHQWLLNK
jgi:Domain of unknown function(DUF2779)